MINQIIKFKCCLKNLGGKYAKELSIASSNIIKTSFKINRLKYLVKLLEKNVNKNYCFLNNNNIFLENFNNVLLHVKTFPDNSTANFYGKWVGSFTVDDNLYALASYPSIDFFNSSTGTTSFNRLALYKLDNNKFIKTALTGEIFNFLDVNLANSSILFKNGFIYFKTVNNLIKINFNTFSNEVLNIIQPGSQLHQNSAFFTISVDNNIYLKDDNSLGLLVYNSDNLSFVEEITLSNYNYKKIFYSVTDNSLYLLYDNSVIKHDLNNNQEDEVLTTNNLFVDFIDYNDKIAVLNTYEKDGECLPSPFLGLKVTIFNKCNYLVFKEVFTNNHYINSSVINVFYFGINEEFNTLFLYNTDINSLGFDLNFKIFDLDTTKLIFTKTFTNVSYTLGNNQIKINEYCKNSNKILFLGGLGGGGLFNNTYSSVFSYKLKWTSCKTVTDKELCKLVKFTKSVIDSK